MSFKSFFKSIGNGIAHAAEDVAHGIEQGAKDVAKGVEGVAEHSAQAIGDVMQGDFRDGLKELGRAGKAIGDTAKAEFKLGLTVGGAMTDLALGTVADAHLGKGLTKLAQSAKGVVDKTRDAVDKSLNQVVDSAEGAVAGGMRCADDVAHGRLDRVGKDSLSVASNAFNVCTSLTPEGMVANVGANLTSTFLNDTPVAKYANVVGDTMARKPLWMLRDGAKDVADAQEDAIARQLADALEEKDRQSGGQGNLSIQIGLGDTGSLSGAIEDAVERELEQSLQPDYTQSRGQGDLSIQAGLGNTASLSGAIEDAVARELEQSLQPDYTQSRGQGDLSIQFGFGNTPSLSGAIEDAVARELEQSLQPDYTQSGGQGDLSIQVGLGNTGSLSGAIEDAVARELEQSLEPDYTQSGGQGDLSIQAGLGNTASLSGEMEDVVARELEQSMQPGYLESFGQGNPSMQTEFADPDTAYRNDLLKFKLGLAANGGDDTEAPLSSRGSASDKVEGLLDSIFSEPALSVSADVSLQLRTV